jgi:hypothetical protein
MLVTGCGVEVMLGDASIELGSRATVPVSGEHPATVAAATATATVFLEGVMLVPTAS